MALQEVDVFSTELADIGKMPEMLRRANDGRTHEVRELRAKLEKITNKLRDCDIDEKNIQAPCPPTRQRAP